MDKKLKAAEKKIEKLFEKYEFYYQWFTDFENGEFAVVVEYGDWKHDHIALDQVMAQNGFKKVDEIVTREDGSDCYDSTHYFKAK